jgi:hypothetical protein
MRGKSRASLDLIRAAYEILESIQPASVRAVCYQLFNRRVIPDMSLSSTRRVGAQLVYAREHELIPWEWIVDETREAERVSQWEDAAQFADRCSAPIGVTGGRTSPAWSKCGARKGRCAARWRRYLTSTA